MRAKLLVALLGCVAAVGCSGRDGRRVPLGVYRSTDPEELIRVNESNMEFWVRRSLDGDQVEQIVEGKFRYSVNADGEIRLQGTSSNGVFLALVISQRWHVVGKNIKRTQSFDELVFERGQHVVRKTREDAVEVYELE
jgi:hypothetical protein